MPRITEQRAAARRAKLVRREVELENIDIEVAGKTYKARVYTLRNGIRVLWVKTNRPVVLKYLGDRYESYMNQPNQFKYDSPKSQNKVKETVAPVSDTPEQ